MAQTLDALIVEVRADIKALTAGFSEARTRIQSFTGQSNREISSLQASVAGVRNAVIAMGGAWAAFRIGQGIVNAGMQMQALENRMLAATGSAQVAADAMAFVRAEAERLGLDVRATGDGFAGFSASALRAGLTLQQTKEIFTGVSEAATSLHLSNDRVQLVFKALEQMAAKGTVQMEELKGQLGESLPGAFEIAAKAMGVTTQELGKMMEQGQLMSADFLPKFAAAIRSELTGSLDEASNSAQAAFNRMNNAFLQLQASLANAGLLDAVTDAVKEMTAALSDPELQKGLAALIEGMGTAIGYAVKLAAALGGLSAKITALADAGMEKVFGKDVGDAIRRQRASNADDSTFSERMLQKYIDDFNAANPAAAVSGSYTLGKTATASPSSSKSAEKASKLRSQLLDQVNSIHYFNSDDTEQENQRYEEQLKKLQEALENKAITQEEYRTLEAEAEQAHQERLAQLRRDSYETQMSDLESAMEGFLGVQLGGQEKSLSDQAKSFRSAIQQAAQHNKAFFALEKAAAIARALIAARQSIVDAYAFGAKIGGPPGGALAAGIAAAAQAANIAAIASSSFGGGGSVTSSGGGGGSSGMIEPTDDLGRPTSTPTRQVYINIGSDDGLMSKAQVRTLLDQINEALKDGSRLDVVAVR